MKELIDEVILLATEIGLDRIEHIEIEVNHGLIAARNIALDIEKMGFERCDYELIYGDSEEGHDFDYKSVQTYKRGFIHINNYEVI